MSTQDFAIGIDFGTTNSSIAVCFKDGKIDVIHNSDTSFSITPSYVFFDEGIHFVGEKAKSSVCNEPTKVVFQMKRVLGKNYDDVEMARNRARWSFAMVKGPGNKPLISITDQDSLFEYSPIEITSMVLKELKEMASEYLSRPVTKAVITVPAKFDNVQRKAIKEAGQKAGLEVIGMINEPTAAAMAYDNIQTANKTFLVFDFGGGTLDVSVMQCDGNSKFRVLATDGDMKLGGADFDELILTHFVQRFQEKHKINLHLYPDAVARLRLISEFAKTSLSGQKKKYLASLCCLAQRIDFCEWITREEFERLCKDLFDRTLVPVRNALAAANTDKSALDFVLLVGGSSRIPKVQEMLKEYFVDVPVQFHSKPEVAIAMGAAVYAQCIQQREAGLPSKFEVIDITPFPLGVEVEGGQMEIMIEKGKCLPTKTYKIFMAATEDQSIVVIKIYEGESSVAAKNHFLGDIFLPVVPVTEGAYPYIGVEFAYDEFRILSVTATDRGGQETIITDIRF